MGHAKGEARLYQYSSTAQDVNVAEISSESRWVKTLLIACADTEDWLGLLECKS